MIMLTVIYLFDNLIIKNCEFRKNNIHNFIIQSMLDNNNNFKI